MIIVLRAQGKSGNLLRGHALFEIVGIPSVARVCVFFTDASLSLRFAEGLVRDMVRRGHQVFYMGPNVTPATRKAAHGWGAEAVEVPLDRTGLNPLADFRTFVWLTRFFSKYRPDVLLTRQPKANVYGMLAARKVGIAQRVAMVTGLGFAFTDGERSLRRSALRIASCLAYKLALGSAELVLFQNPDDLEELSRRGLVDRKKTVLAGGTGIDLEVWRPAPPHVEPLTFTLVGRMLAEKGVREFIAAAREVKRLYPGVHFVLVGPSDKNPGAIPENEIRRSVQQKLIEWVGWTDDVRSLLLRTSVFVLPSYYREGVPLSTQEAMALARPVITTDAPGCRETVAEGVNGFLVPPRDPKALAKAMLHFVEDPKLIDQMGRASRLLAEERFDMRKVNATILEVLGL